MRILMVEDSGAMARAVKRGLDAEGLLTDIAADGQAGLEMRPQRLRTTPWSSTSCFRG